jgi:hypothetical protein
MSYSIYDLYDDIHDSDLEVFIDKLKVKHDTHEYKVNSLLLTLLQSIAEHNNITVPEYMRQLLINENEDDVLIVTSNQNELYITGKVNTEYKIELGGNNNNVTLKSEGENA